MALSVSGLTASQLAPGAPALAEVSYDLAFAVAGFATTRMMLTGGSRQLLDVWAAAIRWGLPGLFTVAVAMLAVSAALLPPTDLKAQAWTALWTAVSLSGLHLMKQGVHDPTISGELLLLHLWATGVAAQLFAGWTGIVAAMIRLRLTRWIGVVAGAGVLASLGLDLWMRGQGMHPQAFYLAPANAWPFLIGAVVAIRPSGRDRVWTTWQAGPAWLGAFAWMFHLWLWPLATLTQMILARPLTLTETAGVVAVAALAVLVTRRWVESPVQRRLGLRPQTALAAGAAGMGALALLAGAIVALDGLPGRADATLRAEEAAMLERAPRQAVCNIDKGERMPPIAACTTPPGGPADVVVWGNSHAAHLTPTVLDWTSRRGLSMRQATKSGCLPLLASADGLADADCLAFNRAAVEEMANGPRPRLVILGAGWTVLLARSSGDDFAETKALERNLTETVRRVRAAVGPEAGIVLLGTTPDFAFAPAACHSRRRFLGLDTRRCDLAPPANATLTATIDGILNRVAQGQPGVHVFHPAVALCRNGHCRTRGTDGPWYADSHHLTPAGGLAQSEALADVLNAASVRR